MFENVYLNMIHSEEKYLETKENFMYKNIKTDSIPNNILKSLFGIQGDMDLRFNIYQEDIPIMERYLNKYYIYKQCDKELADYLNLYVNNTELGNRFSSSRIKTLYDVFYYYLTNENDVRKKLDEYLNSLLDQGYTAIYDNNETMNINPVQTGFKTNSNIFIKCKLSSITYCVFQIAWSFEYRGVKFYFRFIDILSKIVDKNMIYSHDNISEMDYGFTQAENYKYLKARYLRDEDKYKPSIPFIIGEKSGLRLTLLNLNFGVVLNNRINNQRYERIVNQIINILTINKLDLTEEEIKISTRLEYAANPIIPILLNKVILNEPRLSSFPIIQKIKKYNIIIDGIQYIHEKDHYGLHRAIYRLELR